MKHSLNDDQRENVRKILTKYSNQKQEEHEDKKIQDDLFMGAVSGTTVEWHELTPGTIQYPFVREVCCHFESYIRSKKPIAKSDFDKACVELGLKPHTVSACLLSSSVEQADPITLLQLQIKPVEHGTIIERIRFII